jgi:hypothetical protein
VAGPKLLVEIPPHRRTEHEYAISVLLRDWLQWDYEVRVVDGLEGSRMRPAGASDTDPAILLPDVLLAPETSWLTEASLPIHVTSIEAPEWTGIDDDIPLLFPVGEGTPELIHREDGVIELGFDLLGALFFMLSRYEELVRVRARDQHGRFPAEASVAAGRGWLQVPILDIYLHVFVAVARLAWPAAELTIPEGGGLRIGHDVDHPASSMWWHGSGRLRVLAGDLIKRRDPGLALRRAASFVPRRTELPGVDPFNTFDFLMSTSEAVGLESTFYFLTRDSGPPNSSNYRLTDPWATALLLEIARRGHRIGLHGSYNSYVDSSRIANEWAALADACRFLPERTLQPTIRQHFLRWNVGATWRAQQEAGLSVDETLGYADAVGYRAGTARAFTAFDLEAGRPLDIRVQPLHVMDTTLIHYLDVRPDEGLQLVKDLASRTHRFGGDLSVLWHNSSLETAAAKRSYVELLQTLSG